MRYSASLTGERKKFKVALGEPLSCRREGFGCISASMMERITNKRHLFLSPQEFTHFCKVKRKYSDR